MKLKKFVLGVVCRVMYDRDDLRLVKSLFEKGILSGEDMTEFLKSYLSEGYRSNRFQMMTALSRYCGYGVSIADVARFSEDHMSE